LAMDDARDGFDAQAILAAVDAWKSPDSWQVYRAERKYLMANGLGYLFIALMLASIVILPIVVLIVYRVEIDIPWD